MTSRTTRARMRANKKVEPEKMEAPVAGEFFASALPEKHVHSIPAGGRLLDHLTSAERKQYPMTTGLMDYFPDALAMVSHISYLGNQKHNPGEELHWSRGKSMDHADCCARHLEQRGTLDSEKVRHSAQLVWRAMALLQEELEYEYGFSPPRGAGE